MSEERVLGKIDEVQKDIGKLRSDVGQISVDIGRIDERQKTVIKELCEIKFVVLGNGLTKKVNTLENKQENNEIWFGRLWKIVTGIGIGLVLMFVGYLLDKLVF